MEIKTPDLGVDSAEVSEILVAEGDIITENDNIVLLESDKASVEVPSSAAGKITKIMVSIGDTVSEGVVLVEIDSEVGVEADEDTEGHSATEKSNDKTEEPISHSDMDSQANLETQEYDDSGHTQSDETQSGGSHTYSLPDLGVDEAQVAEIMVAEGDTVEAEQSILLIESDKASVEVPSPVAGTIEKILVSAGDTVTNGQDFLIILSADSAKSNRTSVSKDRSEGKSAINNPDSNNVDNKDENKNAQAAQKNPITQEKSGSNSATANQQSKLTEAQVNKKLIDVYAGPAVRKVARQLGVDITQVEGTAPNKRILKEDVFSYVKSHIQTGASSKPVTTGISVGSGLPSLPDMSKSEIWGEIETQDLSRLQKVSIPQLNYNTYLPQVTQFDLSDITETEKLRGELKGEFKAQGIGLTILAFIVKATAYALIQHPRFNSHLSDDNTQIHIRKTVNMGIAVATDDGLIVPVLKDVQNKGIKQIAIEIGTLAGKARDKKLTTKDLQGASFTISSQGNLGGTYFTPLVNWPQVGILGISEASMQPRWNDAKQTFEPRLMLPLSLSYDHRVINGADAAVFTRYVAKLLADPRRILL